MRLRRILVAGLTGAILTGCSSTPPAPSESASGQPVLGQAADTPASCGSSSPNPAALVPGSAVPAAAGTAAPAAGDSPSQALTIGETIAQGVVAYTNGPSSLVGWALDELIGTGDSGDLPPELSTALGNLSSQLQGITTELNTIEGQLAATIKLIQDSTYQDEIAQLTQDHLAPMLSMWQNYCQIVSTKDTTASTLNNLTSTVLDPSTGVRAHVTGIFDAFQGNAIIGEVPLAGMFATFVVNQGVATFDDRPIYAAALDNYRSYFVNLVVMGMSLLIEAQHATGDTVGAQATLTDLWAEVRQLYQAGGAPVSDDNVIVHVPSRTVWARTPLCPTSQYSADAIASGNDEGAGPVQAAIYASVVRSFSNVNNGGAAPDYEFAAGAPVCATSWDPGDGDPTPSSWVPDAIATSPFASNAMNTSTDPASVWRDPTAADFTALVAARGSASPQDYLAQNGFSLPPAGAANFVPQLAYGFWRSADAGWYDLSTATSTCLFAAGCAPSVFPSILLVSTPPCTTGAGSYPGLPTACGTAWIDPLWPAAPPTPATSTTPATTPATTGPPTTTS